MIEDGQIDISIRLDDYYESINNFYSIFKSIHIHEGGGVKLGAVIIVYDDFSKSMDSKNLTIEDCQLEIFININLEIIKNKLKNLGHRVYKTLNKQENYILTKDSSGLKVKIFYKEKEETTKFRIQYSGNMKKIDNFYNALGINCKNGIFKVLEVHLVFFSTKDMTQMLTNDLDFFYIEDCQTKEQIENALKIGGSFINYYPKYQDNDLSYIRDPSGLKLSLGYPNNDIRSPLPLESNFYNRPTQKSKQSIFDKFLAWWVKKNLNQI